MKALYFDMPSGISGDMALACLFQLGADAEAFSDAASGILGAPVRVSLEKVMSGGVSCGRLRIEAGNTARNLESFRDMRRMIVSSSVPETVKSNAIKTISILAGAKSLVCGVPVEDIRFNKAGAADKLICCAGFAWCVNELGIGKVRASLPVFGCGCVNTEDGPMPSPAPAALKILGGVPVKRIDAEGELTTPVGAAILKAYVSEFSNSFYGQVGRDCYAAGLMEFEGTPNFMRAVLFEDDKAENKDEVLLMKTNIDDMSGENFGFLLNTLMDTGALDVIYSPAYGKKNRPLYMLTVMLPREREKEIAKIIFRYSTTAGIRIQAVDRLVMAREMISVSIEGEPVSVKRLYYNDIEKFCPEWDDCVRVSKKIITTPADVHCRAMLLAAKVKEKDEG